MVRAAHCLGCQRCHQPVLHGGRLVARVDPKREGEVLQWLSKGKTNRDIAQILGLSPRTVDKHLEQIYSKLGVENLTAAAAIAVNAKNRNG